jgi:hypothetical protein
MSTTSRLAVASPGITNEVEDLGVDAVWNLVLACPDCNCEKAALLPSRESLAKLLRRNEYYIASNHPIKPRLIQQMGRTVEARTAFLNRQYGEAELMKLHVWRGRVGITPDPLSSFNLVGDIRVSRRR